MAGTFTQPQFFVNHINLKSGQAVITAVVFFLFISVAIILGTVYPVVQDSRLVRSAVASRGSYALAESGQEDLLLRIQLAMQYDDQEVLSDNGGQVTTTIVDDPVSGEKELTSRADVDSQVRKVTSRLIRADEVSFNYGIQAGNGGLLMKNSSLVNGNVYANGSVLGFNSNLVKGTVVSAGAPGLIDGSYATSSAFAHTIQNSTVEGDAYYQVISNTTVLGAQYPNSPDKPEQPLPISDATLDDWESAAEDGGVISSPCPYKVRQDSTLGPVKINCDLEISSSPTVTLTGNVWVSGNITIKNTPTIVVASSLGKKSLALIADKPSDRESSSKVTLSNSVTFQGSGTSGSHIMLVSRNNSSEVGGGSKAIDFDNTAAGDVLLYASHGHILMRNQSKLKSIGAYQLELINNTEVVYDSGSESLLFDTGPGGSWSIISWQEVE